MLREFSQRGRTRACVTRFESEGYVVWTRCPEAIAIVRVLASSHPRSSQWGATSAAVACHPLLACKMTHRSGIGSVDVPAAPGAALSVPPENLVRVFPRRGGPELFAPAPAQRPVQIPRQVQGYPEFGAPSCSAGNSHQACDGSATQAASTLSSEAS